MKKFCPKNQFQNPLRDSSAAPQNDTFEVSFNPGFTLIELLVVITVSAILFTIGIAQYNRFNRQQILSQAALTLKNNLQLIRDRALTGEKDCLGILDGYLVTFSSNSYSFQSQCGSSYGTQTTVNLISAVSFSSYPTSILFKVLGQGANINGSNSITLSGFGNTQTITVTSNGEVR